MINDPLFHALAIAAILITGISKSAFGGTMGGLAVPAHVVRHIAGESGRHRLRHTVLGWLNKEWSRRLAGAIAIGFALPVSLLPQRL